MKRNVWYVKEIKLNKASESLIDSVYYETKHQGPNCVLFVFLFHISLSYLDHILNYLALKCAESMISF